MSTDASPDVEEFDPSKPTLSGIDTLIIGCGNILRGDDATGPVLIRRMWDRGLPDGVHCADGGTEEVEQLPPDSGMNLHAFRWDHAIAFGRWLLKEDYPKKITVYLIEGVTYEVGEVLSAPVDAAIDKLVEKLFEEIGEKA